MFNKEIEYMKAYAKIANEALISMAFLWEQMNITNTNPDYLDKDYPFDKSFDEFVFEFSEWIHNWA
jgi:hypothetical protein